jgi:hypothetical protein
VTKSPRNPVILNIKARRFIVNRIIALSMNGCYPNPFCWSKTFIWLSGKAQVGGTLCLKGIFMDQSLF